MTWWWRLIKFGFRLLYNELAFTYDTVSKIVSLGAWRCWQRSALKYLPPPQDIPFILELAHGTGDLQIDLQQAGYKTIGYDLSPHMGHIATQKLLRQHINPSLIRGEARHLPFANKTIPIVVTTFPTAFIVDADTLNELHRILADNGLLIVVPSGMFVGGGLIQGFLEWLYRITGQRGDTTLQDEFLTYFERFGFAATLHKEACPRSFAQVIVARKLD